MRRFWRILGCSKNEQHKQHVALYIEDTVEKVEPRSYSRLKRVVTGYLEHKIRETDVHSRDRLNENQTPRFQPLALKEQKKGNGGNSNLWNSKGVC